MREPIRIGEYRGFRYADVDDELLENAGCWVTDGTVRDGEDLKAGRVFRWRNHAVKFGRPRRKLTDALRRAPAIRAADRYARLGDVRSPRPLLALERRSGLGIAGDLLVSEFVEGGHLDEIWHTDPDAVAAFPGFLAAMHAADVFHGDFHVANAIWNGAHWYLIDLEDLRHRLHALRRRRLVADQWGLIAFNLECRAGVAAPAVEALFDAYVRRAGTITDPKELWARVRDRVDRYWTNHRQRLAAADAAGSREGG